jgi:CRP-like cAMP-binding protein
MENKIQVNDLKEQILLRGLEENDYESIINLIEYKVYEKGDILFEQGDVAEGIYMIKKGRIRIQKSFSEGRFKTIVIFQDNNFFGDLSVLEKRPHSAAAVALTPAEIFLLSGLNYDCTKGENAILTCRILKRLALIASKNLRQMNEKFLRLGQSF